MEYGMVTCRMPLSKKQAGNKVLEKEGLNPSVLISSLYDYLIQHNKAPKIIIEQENATPTKQEMESAIAFLDSVYHEKNELSNLSDEELKQQRINQILKG